MELPVRAGQPWDSDRIGLLVNLSRQRAAVAVRAPTPTSASASCRLPRRTCCRAPAGSTCVRRGLLPLGVRSAASVAVAGGDRQTAGRVQPVAASPIRDRGPARDGCSHSRANADATISDTARPMLGRETIGPHVRDKPHTPNDRRSARRRLGGGLRKGHRVRHRRDSHASNTETHLDAPAHRFHSGDELSALGLGLAAPALRADSRESARRCRITQLVQRPTLGNGPDNIFVIPAESETTYYPRKHRSFRGGYTNWRASCDPERDRDDRRRGQFQKCGVARPEDSGDTC